MKRRRRETDSFYKRFRTPPLSREEERSLLVRAQAGDPAADLSAQQLGPRHRDDEARDRALELRPREASSPGDIEHGAAPGKSGNISYRNGGRAHVIGKKERQKLSQSLDSVKQTGRTIRADLD